MSIRKYFFTILIVMGLNLQGSLNIWVLRHGTSLSTLAAELSTLGRPYIDPLTARMVGFVILPNHERRAVINHGENKPYILRVGDGVNLNDGLARVVEITGDQIIFEIVPAGGGQVEGKTLVLPAPEVPAR